MFFSERYNIVPSKAILINDLRETCKNKMFNSLNFFFNDDLDYGDAKDFYIYMVDFLGEKLINQVISYDPSSRFSLIINDINHHWDNFEWFQCFDFIEILLQFDYMNTTEESLIRLKDNLNNDFENEKMGYRIIDNQIVDITNESEIEEIEEAIDSNFNTVNDHIQKSLELYSDRKNPDYKNSIKESITAVESMCCIICGENVELGKALGRLEKNGIYIHGAMKNGFQSLYGYTSDESGIRHGGTEDKEVTEEDAKFMLITCSAFVNYLKVKFNKMKENSNG